VFVSDFCLLAQSHSFASLIGILSLLQRYDRCEADADDQQQPRVDDIMRGNVPPNLDDVVGIDNHQQQQPRDDDNMGRNDASGYGGEVDVNEHQCGKPALVFGTR
jgi:hypothetical protein